MKSKIVVFSMIFMVIFSILSCGTKPEEEPVVVEEPKLTAQQLILAGKINEAKALFQYQADVNALDDAGDTALHVSAQVDNADMINFLLHKGAKYDLRNFKGDTPLLVAINYNAKSAIRILAEQGDSIFKKNSDEKTAFMLGAEKGGEYLDALISAKTSLVQDSNGRNLVHYLVESKNIEGIKLCIKKNIPLSVVDFKGISPLNIAYNNSQDITSVTIAAELLMANASPLRGNLSFFEDAVKTRNPSLRFSEGKTPLHYAVEQEEVGIVKYLIERKASVHSKNINGTTALHTAVKKGNVEIVKLLLEAGADPNSQDSLGNTALLINPEKSQGEIIDLLLEYKANPKAKSLYGDTALHVAIMVGMDVEILKKLKDAGADINERNKVGVTPIAIAVDNKLQNHVQFLIDNHADIHAEDIENNTPLSRALTGSKDLEERLAILKIIVKENNIASRDSFGNSPLHVAVNYNAAPIQMDYLLSLNPDINARNKNGDTPLFIAVKNNNRVLGEQLLAKKADVFSVNQENNSALHYAMSVGGEIQDWLLTSEVIKACDGIGNTPLHYAAKWKYDNSVSILLEKGANPDAQNANGETPIFSAIQSNSTSTISLLIKNGANKEARDFLGNTPLHSCVYKDAKDSAKVLILSGADIDAKNLAGQTPLAEAASKGFISMVTLLLDSGANINAFDATGKTILMDSIKNEKVNIASLLLKRGASPSMQEMYGRNAYHEAALTGNIQLITMVRKAGGNPLSRDAHGVTPFSLVMNMNDNIIQAVLGSDNKLVDSDGNTPLHIATSNRMFATKFAKLLKNNYPINARNHMGITPLAMAVRTNQSELAAVLLENGADPYIMDNSAECALSMALKNNTEILQKIAKTSSRSVDIVGDGILHYAARIGDVGTVKLLLSMGLDKTMRNISGETPYDIAVRWQRTEIADLLK